LRYSLLASASFLAVVFTMSTPAQAADCGCSASVRAVLAKEKMVTHAPRPAVKPMVKKPVVKREAAKPAPPMAHNAMPANGDCGCRDTVRAALAKMPAPPEAMPAATAEADVSYDYASARPVDLYPYTHHWTVAPQGYVPPMAMAPQVRAGAAAMSSSAPVTFAAATMTDGGQFDEQADGVPELPPQAPAGFAPQDSFLAYAGGDGYAYGAGAAAAAGASAAAPAAAPVAAPAPYEAGITIEQQGWYGGVSRAVSGVGFGGGSGGGGGGGGGGDGGTALTLAQPDSLNGPNYNSFPESYGGDYQSAGIVNQMRQQALTPPASSGSGSGSK
jgi:uncharacterized membrane protein YgcG